MVIEKIVEQRHPSSINTVLVVPSDWGIKFPYRLG